MPVAGIVRDELDVARLRHADEHRVLGNDRRRRDAAALGASHIKLVPVHVHRVVIHPEIHQADADAFPELARSAGSSPVRPSRSSSAS